MLNKAYRYAVAYFLLFSLLLLASGAVIFSQKIGFSYESVLSYYIGNETTFTSPKSYSGLLKVILPHIFAFALFIMVVLHFLIFTQKRNSQELKYLIYLSFLSALLELFSPFLILWGLHFFVYVKIISFFLFESLLIYALFLLLQSLITE